MSEWAPRRFWQDAAARAAPGGWEVALDGRPVRTPHKAPLVVPTPALAEALAAEWAAVGETLDPAAMPVTRSANSAIDKVAPQHGAVVDALAEYGATDLLCYRAGGPAGLVARQAAEWDPLLDWAAMTLGARLGVTTGVMPAPQDRAALAALRAPLGASDPFALTALHDLIVLSGSLVLGLAAAGPPWDPADLWERSRLDEHWQADLWGRDAEAEADAARRKAAFLHARRFLDLAKGA